jgi:cytochrome c oxidase subunit IV
LAETHPPIAGAPGGPHDGHGSGGDHGAEAAHAHSAMPYIIVWVVLCALTFTTVMTGKMHFGFWALPLALTIASAKAFLVLAFFMHLWEQKGANRMVVVVALVFVLLLLGLTLGDVATRFRGSTPAGAPFGAKVHLPEAQPGESKH